jgi:hypothetical protein
LDDQARYCPTCGQAIGAVELEPSPTDRPGEPAEVTLGAPRRRVLVAVGAVGVVALIVSVVVFDAGRSPSRSAPTTVPPSSAPTTVRPSPTTVRPSPTTPTSAPTAATTVPVTQHVAPHAEAAGVVVYLAAGLGEVVRLDLGTGTVERGSVVAAGNSLGDRQVAPAAEPDEVWLWNQNRDLSFSVRRMRIDGVVTAGPVKLPRFATVLGADGPGAVALAGPGGLYRARVLPAAKVDIEPVWPRVPVAYNDRALLDLTCTGSLDCRLELVDRASRHSRPLSQKPPSDLLAPSFIENSLSPDGAWLAHVNNGPPDGPTLTIYDLLGDGTPISHRILASAFGTPFAFSPDGRWLVFLDPSDTVRLWPVGRPQPPVTITSPGLHDLTALSVAPA